MAHAYTPGLRVSRCVKHRTKRTLPISGEVTVNVGDHVGAQDVVARTFLPGDVIPLNLTNALSVSAGEVPNCLMFQQGEEIHEGDLLAKSHGLFGLFPKEFFSPASGTVETISKITGQVLLRGEKQPVEVKAYLAGEVVGVIPEQGVEIEAYAAMVQGIFGIGGEAYGTIRIAASDPNTELTPELVLEDMRGEVVVGGARMTGDAVRRAIEVGAAAVVSGGMDDQDLKDILGYDLGVAITGQERIGTTLIITEGFGEIAMARRTFELLRAFEGRDASVNGATQIRAGVMRPEILVALRSDEIIAEEEHPAESGLLAEGASIRIIRDPWFGVLGRVASLPHDLVELESGSKARVLTVETEEGRTLTVPRANVEMIEE